LIFDEGPGYSQYYDAIFSNGALWLSSWCLDVMRFAWRVLWWMLRDIGVVDLSFECLCQLLQVNFW
jgi:hypothetical protein